MSKRILILRDRVDRFRGIVNERPAPRSGIVPRHQEEDRRQDSSGTRRAARCDHYAQTDMDELIAAQEMMLYAIFSHAEGTVQ